MDVVAIWRYPVKAMLGERLEAARIGPGGCDGDRRFVVVDAATGRRIANKRGPTDPRLRACRAALIASGDGGADTAALRITLPGGETAEGAAVEGALSDLLERPIRLAAADGPARGIFGATGAHHDLAPVHLITTSTLAGLRAAAPDSDWDVRRFRPNLLLDDGGGDRGGDVRGADGPFAEDALLGARVRAPSGLEMMVGLPTPRCVVPTRAHDGLPADPAILRAIVARHRIDLGPVGRQGCAGSYAEIVRPGRVRVGDRLGIRTGGDAPEEVIRASLARVFA
jgi:MOSC domain-containing protein